MNFDWNAFLNTIVNWLTTTGLKVVVGLLVVWILFKIINKFSKKIEKRLYKNPKVDTTIASFVGPILRKSLKFLIIMCYVGYIGIETSSIAAAIASAGLAIGLALQGALSNVAGGFIILCMRPFKMGDYITTCGESGTVESIQIFYTTLVTPDNKVIVLPNGQVANDTITNASVKSTRRVDLSFKIAYESDFNKAKDIIRRCVDKTGLAINDPCEPFIGVSAHSSSAIDIVCRTWVKSSDYWDLYFKLLEDVKLEFDANGIEIPYNKMDVNIINK